jgi:hypothetical protein
METLIVFKLEEDGLQPGQEPAGRQERIAEPSCGCPLPAEEVLAQYAAGTEEAVVLPMFVP